MKMPRRMLKTGLLALLLLPGATVVRAGAIDLSPLQQDLRLLSGKIAQYGHRLRRSAEGEQKLGELETELARLRESVARLTELAGEIDAKDGHLRYLKTMEIEPKFREIERVRLYGEQRLAEVTRRQAALFRERDQHNASKPDPKNAGAVAAYGARAAEGNARMQSLQAELDRVRTEVLAGFSRAVQAHAKVLKEFSETGAKREKLAGEAREQMQAYAGVRTPLAGELVALENSPPLTPFSQGVPPGEAGLTPRVPPPIGPGTNTHAIDQLRVVTASSVEAARPDIPLFDPNHPDKEAVNAKTVSGYTIDTGGGLPPVALPDVATPNAQPVEEQPEPAPPPPVPLVVPPPPDAREQTPREIKENPKLQAIAQEKAAHLQQLDELYNRRRELARQGANASPEDWTKVVNDISAGQSAIAVDVTKEKMIEGSKNIDLTIVPKSRRHKPVEVPSPVTTAPPENK